MGTLGRVVAAAFEEHFLVCRRSLTILRDTERYVQGMKVATRRLRPRNASSGSGWQRDTSVKGSCHIVPAPPMMHRQWVAKSLPVMKNS